MTARPFSTTAITKALALGVSISYSYVLFRIHPLSLFTNEKRRQDKWSGGASCLPTSILLAATPRGHAIPSIHCSTWILSVEGKAIWVESEAFDDPSLHCKFAFPNQVHSTQIRADQLGILIFPTIPQLSTPRWHLWLMCNVQELISDAV